jgi:hypothetical protein
LVTRFTLITLAAWACRPAPEPAATRDTAAAAVEQAQAAGRDLALSNQNYQRARFVSDIEQVRAPKPVTKPAPQDVVKEGTDSVQVEPIPEPAPVTEPEAPPVTAPDSTTVIASAPSVPSIIPRDAPMPEAVGNSGPRRGTDRGADPGGVVGVVIRGGHVGDDHCRPNGGRGPVPTRIPRFPIRVIIR